MVAEKLSGAQKAEAAAKPSKAAAVALQELFAVGQLVRCSVVALHDKDSSEGVPCSCHEPCASLGCSQDVESHILHLACPASGTEDKDLLVKDRSGGVHLLEWQSKSFSLHWRFCRSLRLKTAVHACSAPQRETRD